MEEKNVLGTCQDNARRGLREEEKRERNVGDNAGDDLLEHCPKGKARLVFSIFANLCVCVVKAAERVGTR